MANKGFFLRDAYLTRTAKLTDEELGRLLRACMAYHATGEIAELEGRESIAFDFIREDIDEQTQAYEAKCETNRRNRIGTTVNDRQRQSTTDDEAEGNSTAVHKVKVKVNEKVKKDNSHVHEREEDDARFEKFWAAYPRKENKKKARETFARLNVDDALLETMLGAIEKWKRSDQWTEDGGRYIPHPTSWMNGKRWEDEAPTARQDPKPTVTAQRYEQRDYSGMADESWERMRAMMEDYEREQEGGGEA